MRADPPTPLLSAFLLVPLILCGGESGKNRPKRCGSTMPPDDIFGTGMLRARITF